MSTSARGLPKSALTLLAALAGAGPATRVHAADAELLLAEDLARRDPDGRLMTTETGRARLRRGAASGQIDAFRAQHLSLAHRIVATPEGHAEVTIDEAESPLAWLARRKGRDGRPLIEDVQFQAGERLRADFTRAQLTPRVTSNWDAAIAHGRRGQGHDGGSTDVTIAARQRVRHALDAVGPEFAGPLLDVCCFLKGLEDIERERRWPLRSAKIVVQLGLDSLARHYGLAGEARGRARAPIRAWADSGKDRAQTKQKPTSLIQRG